MAFQVERFMSLCILGLYQVSFRTFFTFKYSFSSGVGYVMRPLLLIMWTAFQSFILRDNNDLEVAHPQSGSSSTWFLIELEFGNIGFWSEGKTGVPGEKPLGAKEKTNNNFNPQMASTPWFEPGPHGGRRALSPLRHPLLPRLVIARSKSVNNACSIVCVRKTGSLRNINIITLL